MPASIKAQTRQRIELDIALLEKRERHLWLLVLFVLLFLGLATIVTLSFLVEAGQGGGRLLTASRRAALTGLLLLIGLFCAYAFHAHTSFCQVRRLFQRQALKDPLTSLLNRQWFEDRFDEAAARAKREERPFAIILCDLDHFKQINDSQGHQVGDEILQMVAKSTLEATRGSDLAFRWGCDEFLVLVSIAARRGALIVARRIRSGVRRIARSLQLF